MFGGRDHGVKLDGIGVCGNARFVLCRFLRRLRLFLFLYRRHFCEFDADRGPLAKHMKAVTAKFF